MQVSEYGPAAMSGGRSARKKPVFVHLRVSPDYPKDQEAKLTLIHFLKKMGCSGLLVVPWGVFDHPQLTTEPIGDPEEQYKGSL